MTTSNGNNTITADGILRLANSFCDAKALLTAVELGLFTALHESPATAGELRDRLGLDGRGLSDWLELLVSLGLLEIGEGQYRNAPGVSDLLVRGQGSYIGGFIERSNQNLYPAWGKLTDALRTGKPQASGDFDMVLHNPAILAKFIGSMDALIKLLGPQLIEAYPGWSGHQSVLDIGGCRGELVAQILVRQPGLTGTVFDLPEMEPFFREQAAERGLTGRATFHGGDFFVDPLPSADIVLMGHVLHDWDPRQRKALVEKAAASVNPGGALLVYDRMLDRVSSRVENLVISLDMLLVTDGGSEYTVAELRDNALAAGFSSAEDQPLGEYDTLVICRKPA